MLNWHVLHNLRIYVLAWFVAMHSWIWFFFSMQILELSEGTGNSMLGHYFGVLLLYHIVPRQVTIYMNCCSLAILYLKEK